MHLAKMLEDRGGFPLGGNQPAVWADGERFGYRWMKQGGRQRGERGEPGSRKPYPILLPCSRAPSRCCVKKGGLERRGVAFSSTGSATRRSCRLLPQKA